METYKKRKAFMKRNKNGAMVYFIRAKVLEYGISVDYGCGLEIVRRFGSAEVQKCGRAELQDYRGL